MPTNSCSCAECDPRKMWFFFGFAANPVSCYPPTRRYHLTNVTPDWDALFTCPDTWAYVRSRTRLIYTAPFAFDERVMPERFVYEVLIPCLQAWNIQVMLEVQVRYGCYYDPSEPADIFDYIFGDPYYRKIACYQRAGLPIIGVDADSPYFFAREPRLPVPRECCISPPQRDYCGDVPRDVVNFQLDRMYQAFASFFGLDFDGMLKGLADQAFYTRSPNEFYANSVSDDIDTFRRERGYYFDFVNFELYSGICPDQARWDAVQSILPYHIEAQQALQARGIKVGQFFLDGGYTDESNRAWFCKVKEFMVDPYCAAGGRPDHIVYGSYGPAYPNRALSERDPYTLTNLAALLANTFIDRRVRV